MPAAPRLRQLRRDKIVSGFVLNVLRLDLEEDDRLVSQPGLREQPDEALHHLHQIRRYWQGMAAVYVMRKSRCSVEAAVRVGEELLDELGDTLPEAEIRAVPLREALDVPVERLPSALRPPAAPAPHTT